MTQSCPAGVIKRHGVRVHAQTAELGSVAAVDARARLEADRSEKEQAALEHAYQQGLAAGRAAAELEGQGAVPALAVSIERGLAAVADALRHRTFDDGHAVASAAVDVAQWVLAGDLPDARVDVTDRVCHALTRLVPSAAITIHVAPTHVAALQDWAAGAGGGASAGGQPITVVGDVALRPGEARIAAGLGEADLSFAGALSRLRTALDDHTVDSSIDGTFAAGGVA